MKYDVIMIGAGASGLMAAICAAERGRSVLVLDHAGKPGRKLLVSGGGKCNVTNRQVSVADYYGANPAFARFALKQWTTRNALDMLDKAGIETEERDFGRVFGKRGAQEIVSYLVRTAERLGVRFAFHTAIENVSCLACDAAASVPPIRFCVQCKDRSYESDRLLIATGGLAWPQLGATNFGYTVARQFGHTIRPLTPALTGFVLPATSPLMHLQGISLDVRMRIKGKNTTVEEPLLFTHKGISGPAVLQTSCLWEPDDEVLIDFLPAEKILAQMHEPANGKLFVKNLVVQFLPERLANALVPEELAARKVAELSKKDRKAIETYVHSFPVVPVGVEGFSKAEATMGGVSTDEVNPKTMESRKQQGLFFSGEVLDITGRLGGYNIHWAFASGQLAGRNG